MEFVYKNFVYLFLLFNNILYICKKSWFIKMFYIYCVYKMLWARVKNETAKNIKYRKWKQ